MKNPKDLDVGVTKEEHLFIEIHNENVQQFLLTHMMNSLGWQTTDATPPTMIQGLITVWPPVTEVPPSSAASRNPRIISGITRSRSCVTDIQMRANHNRRPFFTLEKLACTQTSTSQSSVKKDRL